MLRRYILPGALILAAFVAVGQWLKPPRGEVARHQVTEAP
jgi:hypothetical protein